MPLYLPIWKRLGQVCFLFEREAITDDHQADIRGLVTAFACVRPELPQSTPRELEQMLISQAENEDSPTEALLSNSFLQRPGYRGAAFITAHTKPHSSRATAVMATLQCFFLHK